MCTAFEERSNKPEELPTLLRRSIPSSQEALEQGEPEGPTEQLLMQWHGPDDVPFVCLPGVREYHEQPAHSGDLWLLHRGGAEGTLHHLLEQLYTYGVEPLIAYNVGIQIAIAGFQQGPPPT